MGQIMVEHSLPLAAGALEDCRGQLGRDWAVAEHSGMGMKPDQASVCPRWSKAAQSNRTLHDDRNVLCLLST